jgi:thiosulfate/3-mercaptopyruvate sulfurtransferase
MKRFKMVAAGAVLSVVLVGCASHGTSPKGLEIPDVKDGGYKIVGTEELKKWLDEGKKVNIISALPAAEDKSFGTLPFTVNGAMPKTEKDLTQADKDNLLKAAGPEKEKTIAIYCGFVACRRSHIGAKLLVENGFQNVYRYPGGITAWQEMGYPVTK